MCTQTNNQTIKIKQNTTSSNNNKSHSNFSKFVSHLLLMDEDMEVHNSFPMAPGLYVETGLDFPGRLWILDLSSLHPDSWPFQGLLMSPPFTKSVLRPQAKLCSCLCGHAEAPGFASPAWLLAACFFSCVWPAACQWAWSSEEVRLPAVTPFIATLSPKSLWPFLSLRYCMSSSLISLTPELNQPCPPKNK